MTSGSERGGKENVMTEKQRARLAEIKEEIDDLGGELVEMSEELEDDFTDIAIELDNASGSLGEAITFIEKAEAL